MKQLTVNGVEHAFGPDEMPATLSDLLARLQIGAVAMVAEVDGVIVKSEDFSQTPIQNSRRIELVKFMGGG